MNKLEKQRIGEKIRVMLVDDSLIFLNVSTRFLQGYEQIEIVGSAQNGQEALALAPVLKPHVILLDLNMPGMSGLEVIPKMRALLPDASIIVLSLVDTNGHRQAAFSAGAENFIPKSNMLTGLIPAILNTTREKQPQAIKEAVKNPTEINSD